MLFQAYWQWPQIIWVFVIDLWVLYRCDVVVTDQVLTNTSVLFAKLMTTHSSLICYLVRDKLSMMSRGNTFIDDFILFDSSFDGGVRKLCHFWVIGEHVDWQLTALSNCDKLFGIVVVVSMLPVL